MSRENTLGVQKDPTARTSVKGLTLSGNLSDMLPAEAVLPADTLTYADVCSLICRLCYPLRRCSPHVACFSSTQPLTKLN